VSQRLGRAQAPSTTGLREQIQRRVGAVLHRRTLEKLVKDLRAKKNSGA